MKLSAKVVFNLVYWPLFLLCNGLFLLMTWKRILPRAARDYHEIIFFVLNIVVGAIALQACRVLGVSQEGETVEIYQRVGRRNVNFVERVACLKTPEWQSWLVTIIFFLLTLLCDYAAYGWIFNTTGNRNYSDAWVIIGFLIFGCLFAASAITGSNENYGLLAGQHGVRGSATPFALQTKVVSWDAIQNMEIVTKRDCEGEIHSMTAIFKNAAQQQQTRVFLPGVPEEVRDKFFQVVIENAGLQKQS